VLLALNVMLITALSRGSEPGCDGVAVAAVAPRLISAQTWSAIHRSIETYPGCDDGVVAEEYSDRIVHLLATRWKSVANLNRLVAADPKFGKFVIGHIDATTDVDELHAIVRRPTHDCPRAAADLCKEIAAAATAAAREAGSSE
jgi:hypothetical protein